MFAPAKVPAHAYNAELMQRMNSRARKKAKAFLHLPCTLLFPVLLEKWYSGLFNGVPVAFLGDKKQES